METAKELISFIRLFETRLQALEIETSVDYITKHNEPQLGFECFIDYLSD